MALELNFLTADQNYSGYEWKPGIYSFSRLCDVWGCFNKHATKGLCESHAWKIRNQKMYPHKRILDESFFIRKGFEKELTELKNSYREHSKVWRKNKIRARNRQIPNRFNVGRYSAKKRGRAWTITLKEFEWLCELDCFYCGGALGRCESGIGLDRIDNARGYEIDNVYPCCGICNGMRSNVFTVQETKLMIQSLLIFKQSSKNAKL